MCKVTGCGNAAKRKNGMCHHHYRLSINTTPCSVDGCDSGVVGRGLCSKHWQRWRKHGDPNKALRSREYGHTRKTSGGYIVEHMPGHFAADDDGRVLQHRRIMAEQLDRKLKPYENVHHKNGVRDDNRLENLELWITQQPKGQRLIDLQEWALWILQEYPVEQ